MNKFYGLYVKFGVLLFWLLLPIERFFLRKTTRAYALIIKDDKVLMIKNWLSDGKWALPGGGVHSKEPSWQALKRELKEEIKIELQEKDIKHFADGNWLNHKFGFKYDIYLVKAMPDFKVNRRLEITEAAWVDIASLNKTNTAIDIVNVLARL